MSIDVYHTNNLNELPCDKTAFDLFIITIVSKKKLYNDDNNDMIQSPRP